MIPRNYEEWIKCIEDDCKIYLTKGFCKERVNTYADEKHPETVRFVDLYGLSHKNNVLNWFYRALNEGENQF